MAGPTISRRQLSGVLRRLRRERQMTLEQVAERLEWSTAKVSNFETGRTAKPSVTDVSALLRVYDISAGSPEDRAILALVRQSRQRGRWAQYGDVLTGEYAGLEEEASRISSYEPIVIPGLLQTPEYARLHMQSASAPRVDSEIDRTVEARVQRQEEVLQGSAPELWVIIDENALRRMVVDQEVMRGQIDHLITVSEDLTNAITVQVLPVATSFHSGLVGPFVILEYADEDIAPFVFLETDTDGLYLEREEEVGRYRRLFEQAQSVALGPQDSVQLMRGLTT
ncbi:MULTISPECIES: helix-turn-helix transcriptional regulator [unclassified Nocardiopsis]|uniref:helix-turn-helix domain-containing protein n=1 Tax=unclassified Nocardiopsis TaxID=2649073 RepID=UPI00066B2CF2|nr:MULTISPECIES: helix-turn-helix transcriptional regulator [unclassified Nocardiopsis]MBQ1081915.1 helix-turn-helix domain-containing protein [Nocardiopsis sp. B62]